MLRKIKRISLLLAALTMIFGTTLTTLAADSSVSFEGGAEEFVFIPGSEYTDTDLFNNFKDVMPGDELQQKIIVKNNFRHSDYVKIYMRAVVHDENGNPLSENVALETALVSMQDFLSQLSMTVLNEGEVIYQASPDELDGLSENVLLGSFEPGDETELIVQLNVPIELGNEYANRLGEVDWVFVAEELNNPEEIADTVKTGDDSNSFVWIMLMLVSGSMICLIGYKKYVYSNRRG